MSASVLRSRDTCQMLKIYEKTIVFTHFRCCGDMRHWHESGVVGFLPRLHAHHSVMLLSKLDDSMLYFYQTHAEKQAKKQVLFFSTIFARDARLRPSQEHVLDRY